MFVFSDCTVYLQGRKRDSLFKVNVPLKQNLFGEEAASERSLQYVLDGEMCLDVYAPHRPGDSVAQGERLRRPRYLIFDCLVSQG
jgi:hypothetical protein